MADLAFQKVAGYLKKYEQLLLSVPDEVKDRTSDIRLKAGQPLVLAGSGGSLFLDKNGRTTRNPNHNILICSPQDIQDLFLQLCTHSVFSHENEIKNGYITVDGQYRVGICGTAVLENNIIKTIKDISSLVFRIPREIKGCSRDLFYRKPDLTSGILVIGEPSSGKTTFLRDMVQALSYGLYTEEKRVSVLDEKSEISGAYDLGPSADVLRGYPKRDAFEHATRMFSPEIIICDELSDRDFVFLDQSLFAGVSMVASVHSNSRDILKRPLCRRILQTGAFETIVFLDGRKQPCKIEKICTAGELLETDRYHHDYRKQPDDWLNEGAKPEKKGTDAA